MSILVKALSYAYGTEQVLHKVSFAAQAGTVLGLLGPNGAGKSTLMRLLMGYLPIPGGSRVEICGSDLKKGNKALRRRMGYLPEHNPLYEDMYLGELLRFYGRLYGLSGARLRGRINEMISACGLQEVVHKKVHTLSKGYRQRLGLARALLHNPEVLILDEPTSGLDPNQIIEIRQLIRSLQKKICILFSTHILQEAEVLCDEVILLHKGRLLTQQSLSTLKTQCPKSTFFEVSFSEPLLGVEPLQALGGLQRLRRLSAYKYLLQSEDAEPLREALLQASASHRLPLCTFHEVPQPLEDLFQQLTQKAS